MLKYSIFNIIIFKIINNKYLIFKMFNASILKYKIVPT